MSNTHQIKKKNTVITDAGYELIQQSVQGQKSLKIDKMLFAQNNHGEDECPSSDFSKPTTVFEANIIKTAKIDNHKLVYSAVLGSDYEFNGNGDFSIDTIMLYSSENNCVVAVSYVPNHKKYKSKNGQVGNTLYKNFALVFNDICSLENVTVPAESWQYDFDQIYSRIGHSHENLLINGSFDVRQRGNSFNNPQQNSICFDCWNVLGENVNSINYEDEQVKIIGNSDKAIGLYQTTENFFEKDTEITFAARIKSSKQVRVSIEEFGSMLYHNEYSSGSDIMTISVTVKLKKKTLVRVHIASTGDLNIYNAKLEYGSSFTRFGQTNYAEELLKCGPLESGQYLTKDGDNFKWQGFSNAPVGSIILWGGTTPPDGYMECNGDAISRNSYSILFDKIGTTYGNGNNSTTFNLPDLRGEFVRGWDHGKGIDASRQLGSSQGDAIRNISGKFGNLPAQSTGYDRVLGGAFTESGDIALRIGQGEAASQGKTQLHFDASRVVPTANENRPRNVALMYCIKVRDAITNPENIDIKKFLDDHENKLVGSVVALSTTNLPEEYLECNGAAVNRTSYAALFSKIGTTFGTGDGSTTFNIPDLRGEFIRGFDNGRGIDADRNFGSNQADELKSHRHKISSIKEDNTGGSGTKCLDKYHSNANIYSDYVGGDETRPRNVAMIYAIKY